MILVDMPEQEIEKKGRRLSEITFEYDFDFELTIMPIVKILTILTNGSIPTHFIIR